MTRRQLPLKFRRHLLLFPSIYSCMSVTRVTLAKSLTFDLSLRQLRPVRGLLRVCASPSQSSSTARFHSLLSRPSFNNNCWRNDPRGFQGFSNIRSINQVQIRQLHSVTATATPIGLTHLLRPAKGSNRTHFASLIASLTTCSFLSPTSSSI